MSEYDRDDERERASREAAREQAERCLHACALPALTDVRDALIAQGFSPGITQGEKWLQLEVEREQQSLYRYCLEARTYHKPTFAYPALHGNPARPRQARLYRWCSGQIREWLAARCDRDSLYADALAQCRKWLPL